MKRLFTILLLSFLYLNFLGSQCLVRDIPISERAINSTQIVNAKIIDSHSFQKEGHIYTSYSLKDNKNGQIIHLIVKGGQFGDLIELISPSLILNIGDEGLFYLNKSIESSDSNPLFTPAIGVLSFIKYNPANETFEDYLHIYAPKDFQYTPARTDLEQTKNDENISFRYYPRIDLISPLIVTAGTKQVITIKGINFGNNAAGKALIEFRNPDYATGAVIAYQSVSPEHILSWTNNKIEVLVPGKDPYLGKSGAASGNIRLRNTFGEVCLSSQKIKVLYNQFSNGTNGTLLVNDNDFGGYTLSYNEKFKSIPKRVSAFERALESWQCGIHSSYIADGSTTSVGCPANDGINLISMDTKCNMSPELLAQTTHWFIQCSKTNTILLEMDLIFDDAVKWFYDTTKTPTNKFDFESVALHELGHAHGMGHVLEKENIMFANFFPGEMKRIIDTNSVNCGLNIIERSSKFNNCTDVDSFIPYPECGLPCELSLMAIPTSDCNIDHTIEYTITAMHSNVGNKGFNLFLDGIKIDSLSPIKYNLTGQTPLKIRIPGDGLNHILTIQDVLNEDCIAEDSISVQDCNCSLGLDVYQTSNCKNGVISYTLNISDTNGSNAGFNIYVDNILLEDSPYEYSNDGNTIIQIELEGDNQNHLIEIRDNSDDDCIASSTIKTPSCTCSLDMSSVLSSDCNEKEQLGVFLQIISENPGSSGFNLYVDNNLYDGSPFPYMSTDTTNLIIFMTGDGNTHEIRIIDRQDEDCFTTQSISLPNCQCELDFTAEKISGCNASNEILYKLIVSNPVSQNNGFNLFVDDIKYGNSPYNYSSIDTTEIIVNLSGDGNKHFFRIEDIDKNDCSITKEVLVENCDCSLELYAKQTGNCTPEMDISYKLTIIHSEEQGEQFNLWINGVLDSNSPYDYSTNDSTTLNISLPGDGLDHLIEIKDLKNPNCVVQKSITTPVCDCQLSFVATQISDCDETKNIAWSIEVSNSNTISDKFLVFVDGINTNSDGYKYTTPKTYIELNIAGDGEKHKIIIQDKTITDCLFQSEIQSPDCKCNLSLETAIESDCDEFNNIEILGSIILKNIYSDSFYVFVDGEMIDENPFKYENKSFSNFKFSMKGDGLNHLIKIQDISDEECSSITTILVPDCRDIEPECELSFLSVQSKECEDDQMEIIVSFKGAKQPSEQFEIYQNDQVVPSSPYNYHSSGINTLSINASCTTTTIMIKDLQNKQCKIDTTIIPVFKSEGFQVYPNLFNYNEVSLQIKGISSEDFDKLLPINIYNFVGEKVYRGYILGSPKMTLDLKDKDFSSGAYFLIISNNKDYIAKFVIVN